MGPGTAPPPARSCALFRRAADRGRGVAGRRRRRRLDADPRRRPRRAGALLLRQEGLSSVELDILDVEQGRTARTSSRRTSSATCWRRSTDRRNPAPRRNRRRSCKATAAAGRAARWLELEYREAAPPPTLTVPTASTSTPPARASELVPPVRIAVAWSMRARAASSAWAVRPCSRSLRSSAVPRSPRGRPAGSSRHSRSACRARSQVLVPGAAGQAIGAGQAMLDAISTASSRASRSGASGPAAASARS